eukprot:TRINITY_DN22445_c0_g1_i1.p1 TRINITY_DN22445_c0_g1~~TRINITY_DN22445_c0_g1_i1.p1  ORF type:complete len:148 (-),score=24.25 TRINITY_DN22445_c0_g1_i1:168-611(-)
MSNSQGLCLLLFLLQLVGSLPPCSSLKVPSCSTPECLKVSKWIRLNMNASVDPCDNFYEFACGGFKERSTIPQDAFTTTRFTIQEKKMMVQLRDLLEDESLKAEQESIGLAQTYYKACMDNDKIEAQGLDPLKELIEYLGGWPMLQA